MGNEILNDLREAGRTSYLLFASKVLFSSSLSRSQRSVPSKCFDSFISNVFVMVRLAFLGSIWLGCSLISSAISTAVPRANDGNGAVSAVAARDAAPEDAASLVTSLSERQESRTQQMGQQLANIITAFVDACRAGQLNTMGEWTKQMSMKLKQENPYKNIMIVHVKHDLNFAGSRHEHFELKMPCVGWGTRGYEIYVFDYGEFWLHGDRGYENWAFAGYV
jgi:hypothetical protein